MSYQVTEQAAGMGAQHRKSGPRHAKPTTVRKAGRVAVALSRLTVARRPRWAAKAIAVAVAIPGFIDELVLVPAIVAYVVITHRAEFASVARSTWKGQTA